MGINVAVGAVMVVRDGVMRVEYLVGGVTRWNRSAGWFKLYLVLKGRFG